jgi:hypothetical protein
MARYEINKKNRFRSLVPMMSLIMDVLNSELAELDNDFITYSYPIITNTIVESINEFESIKKLLGSSNPYMIQVLLEPTVSISLINRPMPSRSVKIAKVKSSTSGATVSNIQISLRMVDI